MKNRGKVFKGFALVEVIVLLLATSVAISSSMVGMSVRKSSEVKVDQNVQNCILVENGNPASAACQAMVNGCKYNQESSCNTLATYANSANATQAQFALTALKDACYNGSKRACDYIVKSCAENSSKCDIASTEGDLKYFLDLNTTVSSAGRFYIEKELQNYYKNGIKNIVNEIDTICPTPCNDAGDNYWKTACGVLRAVKGAGFCQDINEDVPNPSPPPPPPAAPTSLTASLASSTTVQLTWNDVATNEDGYYVYQSIGSVNNWQQIKTLAANSTSTVVDLGSTPAGGTYYYLVRAYNSTEGPGAPSNTANVFMIGYPNPPTLQNGSFDGTQTVTLTWVDNANNEDGFKVWQKVPSGSFVLNKTIATPNVTTTTIDLGSNPVNGTYSYYLQAYNSVLTSANSNTFDVAVATKPWVPVMSSISQAYTGGNYIIHLCWTDTSHNETGFHVLQKIGAGSETTVATVAANTTCADINLGATPTFATYYYNVDAYNAQGTTLATGGPLSTVAPMVPTAPSGVSTAVATPTSVSLTWTDNASNETGFKVYQKIDSGAWTLVQTIATPNTTSTTVSLGSTPPPGTYYYKVRTYNTISGESTDSNSSSVAVEGYPNPPSGVTSSFDGSQTVTVSWTDNASNETGFKVWQKSPSGTFILNKTIATPNTTSTTIDIGSNPENGTYQYYVESYNTSMTSDPSVTATVSVATAPLAPSGFGISSGMSGTDHIVTLTWGDASHNEQGFKIYQQIKSGVYVLIDTLAPNTTTKVINYGVNPTPYGTYAFKVSAYNTVAEVYYPGGVSTGFPAVPHTPTTLTSSYDGVQTITLSWTDNSHNEDGFKVWQKTPSGSFVLNKTIATPNTTSTTINVGASPENGTWQYYVQAYNSLDTSSNSNTASVSVITALPPTAPSGLTGSFTEATHIINLNWTDNAHNETGFKIWQKVPSGSFVLNKTIATPNTTTTTIDIGANPASGVYQYYVQAYNAIGTSADSNTKDITAGYPPATPTGLSGSFDGVDTVSLNWTDNSNNEDGYKVIQNNGYGWVDLQTIAVPNTQSTTVNLGPNPVSGTYQYYVVGYNAYSYSVQNSNTISLAIASKPRAPSGTTASFDGVQTVSVNWTDNSGNETGFKVWQKITTGSFILNQTIATPNTTSTTINLGASPTIGTYQYYVQAYNANGTSANSNTVSISVIKIPIAPASLTASYNSATTTVTLNWTCAATNETGFKVYQMAPADADFVLNKTIATANTITTTVSLGASPASGTYQYYVRSYNAGWDSANSNTASISVVGAPSDVTASFDGVQTVTVNWADNSNNETGFKVWQKITTGSFILNKTIATPNTTSTTIDIGASPTLGTWQYYVQAYNASYTSANSNTASVTIIKIPIAPASLTASYNSATTTVTLNWTCAATNETGFKVYQMAPADADFVLNKTIATANTITTTVSLGASPASGTYQYYVRSYNAGWDSANSNTASISVVGAPSDVTASFDGTQTVTVNWTDNAANEDGFKVWQKTPSGSFILNQTIATPDTTSTTIDLGANPANGTYQYYVQAYNVGGTSVNSNTASLAVVSPPAAPSSVAGVQNGAQTINLTWTDNANNETGFKVYQKGPADSDFVLNKTIATANTTSTSIDLGASPTLGTYEYYVQAYNATYTSVNSNTASVVVVAAPPDPVNLWIEDVGGTLRYHWIDPSGDPSLYIYRVRSNLVDTVSGSSSNVIDGPGNERTYDDDSPLTAPYMGDYTITVQQYDFAHNLKSPGVTIIVYVEPISYFVPAAPRGLSGVFDGTQTVTLNWTDNTTTEDGFKIWQKTPSGSFVLNKVIATRNVTSAAINLGANPELGTYQYYVQSYNAGSTSANSNTASVAVMYPPTAPSGTAASFDGTQTVTVNWTDNSHNEDGYKVWQKTPSGSFVLNKTIATPNTTSTTINVGASPENGTWQYYVQAYNSLATSSNSNTASVSVYPVPAAATGAAANPASATTVTVSWTDNSYNETGFYVYQSINTTTNWVLVATVGANVTSTVVDLGSTPAGGTYYYKVRAYNSVSGESADSNIPSASIAGYPQPPSGVSGSFNGAQTITLNWTDNANNEAGFKVWEKDPGGSFVLNKTIATPNTTSTTVDIGANPVNGTYQYYVQAYNASMTSANSNTASVAVATVPLAPTGLSAPASVNVSATTPVPLTWTDASHNETGFKIYRKITTGSYALLTTTAAGATSYTNNLGASPTTGSYYYKLTASNATGESGYSNEVTVNIILPPPAAPSGLGATKSISTNFYANLTWTDNATNESGFKIFQNSVQVATVGANVTSTSYSLGVYPTAATYTYTVKAYNASGDSAASNSASITITAAEACVNGCDNGVTAACTACTSSNYNKSCLQIYNQMPGSTGWHVINAKGTTTSVYCDNTVGDGGWTLLAYSGSTTASMNYWGSTAGLTGFTTDATKGVSWGAQDGVWKIWQIDTSPNMTYSAVRLQVSGEYANAGAGYVEMKNGTDTGTLKFYFLDFSGDNAKGQSMQKDGAWVYGNETMGVQRVEVNYAVRWDSGWGPTQLMMKMQGAPNGCCSPAITYFNRRWVNWFYIR